MSSFSTLAATSGSTFRARYSKPELRSASLESRSAVGLAQHVVQPQRRLARVLDLVRRGDHVGGVLGRRQHLAVAIEHAARARPGSSPG